MKTRRTLLPGQPGTKTLQRQYGDDLICVRYRYDATHKERLKTVELVVERSQWEPDPQRIPPNKHVAVRVGWQENRIQRQIREVGGTWNSEERVWELLYKDVRDLGLTDRLVREGPEKYI